MQTTSNTEREERLENFLRGDLDDAIKSTALAASSDRLGKDTQSNLMRALFLLKRVRETHS